jgi:hypothetical protein
MRDTLPDCVPGNPFEDTVAYSVRMSDPVRGYLRTHAGLSREGRLRLVTGVLSLLRDHGDILRSAPFETPGIRFV